MYSDDVLARPTSEKHFWLMVEDNFEHARHVLEDYDLQTREQALAAGHRPPMRMIAYRDVDPGYDQREYFHDLGRSLLPVVRAQISRRELSFAFCQEWGKLMFCHGFLAGYVFDDSDDMAAARGASKSAEVRSPDARERWLAHVFALPQFSNLKRDAADQDVAEFLMKLHRTHGRSHVYPARWFEQILDLKTGTLRSAFQGKNFPKKKMVALRRRALDDLPPIPE